MTRRELVSQALGGVSSYREIEDGYDFVVAVADEEWAFRFPRRPGVEPALRTEIALLPELAAALPAAVPRFEHVLGDPLCVGYRLIAGEPLAPGVAPAAGDVGRFLAALHGFDVARARALGVPAPDWRERYVEQCAEFSRRVLPLLAVDERPAAERLLAGAERLGGLAAALVHADLGPEHMLCRDGRLAGVIDWGDVCVGDPALDFAWLLDELEPAALDALFAGYGRTRDPGFDERARFYHSLWPWYETHHGVFTGNPGSVERGLRAVRASLAE